MGTGRRSFLITLPAAAVAGWPSRAAADPDKDESGKRREGDKKEEQKRDERRPAPVPPQPTSRSVAFGPPSWLTGRSGSDQMVSDSIRIAGHDGSGAGPLVLDVEGARPASAYQIVYVPQSNPGLGVILGTVRTDAAGAFKGAAPEPLPAIPDVARQGLVVFRRLLS